MSATTTRRLLPGPLGLGALGILLALSGLAGGCAEKPARAENGGASARAEKVVVVTAAPLAERDFEARLAVQGNVEAKRFALVGPKLPGTLDAVLVEEGDRVVAGETVLFRTEATKLEQAVQVRRLDLALAKSGVREKRANKERIDVDLAKAKLDYERQKKLFASHTVSEDAKERAESRYRQVRAMSKHAGVLVDLALDQRRQAEVALEMAEKDLRDATILAPVSGVVSERRQEPGEMGQPGKTVVRVDDPSVVEVSALLPAAHYPRVTLGRTPMRVRVYGVDLGAPAVAYKSPTIATATRTFEVKCELTNSEGQVAPGAMADIEVVLDSRRALGVPAASVVERGGRPVVFVAESGVARMVPVETGLTTDGYVEVRGDGLAAGVPVVSLGQTMLDDGSRVKVKEATR